MKNNHFFIVKILCFLIVADVLSSSIILKGMEDELNVSSHLDNEESTDQEVDKASSSTIGSTIWKHIKF